MKHNQKLGCNFQGVQAEFLEVPYHEYLDTSSWSVLFSKGRQAVEVWSNCDELLEIAFGEPETYVRSFQDIKDFCCVLNAIVENYGYLEKYMLERTTSNGVTE